MDEFHYGSTWTQTMRVICPSIRVVVFDFVYTLASKCVYDANLKIFMFEPRKPRAIYNTLHEASPCAQDVSGIITGPAPGFRCLCISSCQAIGIILWQFTKPINLHKTKKIIIKFSG